jgi:exoribonuclease R
MSKIKITVDVHKHVHFFDIDGETEIRVPPSISNKFFHNDVIYLKNTEFVILESPVRDTFHAGVLVVSKTYGRCGRRLLYRCIPDNPLFPAFLVPYDIQSSFHKNIKNKYIVFRFDHWDDDHPRGEIKDTLGDVDSDRAFEEYQMWRRGLQISLSNFSNIARQQIRKTGADEAIYIDNILAKNPSIIDRRIGHNVFTIDPEGCTDFDDAFSVSMEGEVATVCVYIANVFLWLETYGLWDFVSDRVSTIYLPDRKVPMLPPMLSDLLCSLKQGHDRFAFMMCLEYNMATKEFVGEPVYENVLIHINKNYVYEDEKNLKKNAGYRVLRELASSIYEKRHEKSIYEKRDYEKRDLAIDSHDVVSFWMIKMNSECAQYLSKTGKGIFRGSLPKTCPEFLFEKSAIAYQKEATPHLELGLSAYVHITSPIRRLVDILNQILFQKDVSTSCQTFFDKWMANLNKINHATKEIRRVQMDCELLALCSKCRDLTNREFAGLIFDKDAEDSYMVYIEELKLVSRFKSQTTIEMGAQVRLKIYMFQDEHKLCKKVRFAPTLFV